MIVDYLLRLWGAIGIALVKFIAPGRAIQFEKLWFGAIAALPPCSQQAVSPQATRVNTHSERRVTCDLNSDIDQDAELVSLATDVLMQARMVPPSSHLEHGEACLTQSTLSEDVHKMVTCTNFKVNTPEKQLRNLMGLLLQANEDNVVLKSALHCTLDKLQTTRDELHATKSELTVTQEQASLLLEERESATFMYSVEEVDEDEEPEQQQQQPASEAMWLSEQQQQQPASEAMWLSEQQQQQPASEAMWLSEQQQQQPASEAMWLSEQQQQQPASEAMWLSEQADTSATQVHSDPGHVGHVCSTQIPEQRCDLLKGHIADLSEKVDRDSAAGCAHCIKDEPGQYQAVGVAGRLEQEVVVSAAGRLEQVLSLVISDLTQGEPRVGATFDHPYIPCTLPVTSQGLGATRN
ncbi:hypothetical protein CEUSTIGMA_g7811.t1 [Chlamydomonas eustigma]|uniref:Uncharacterized protein n=1 Tax=Chlamydomonas eustigma TaxID=1157962 RepID=A0A250XBX0_9CHLO|nr:hypothetical protein CEUSTIGMA_g7811.t1 [Chlamydomonas eustigma]|eukprot:GAX80372.1 hypothetical protein CEUSTIGMA_g7811.t1 [Chlamydomonas eustigma]